MNTIHQKAAWFITALLLFTITISCEEQDADLGRKDGLISSPLGFSEKNTANISNGILKENLIKQASAAYANWYNMKLTAENTRVIDGDILHAWINANESNKHESINEKNKAALAKQGNVQALLVTAPAGAKFKESVFVIGKTRSIVITDITDIADLLDRWPRVAMVGVGFKGTGFYDSSGHYIHCICVEEYKIVFSEDDITHCRNCSVLNDNPF